VECGNLLPLCSAEPIAELELSPRRYHVFARTAQCDRWIYIAPIHRRPDAVAVSAGLIESGLAIEAEIAVIAQSPGPLAGKVLIVYRKGPEARAHGNE
jgi:hypothetical protein